MSSRPELAQQLDAFKRRRRGGSVPDHFQQTSTAPVALLGAAIAGDPVTLPDVRGQWCVARCDETDVVKLACLNCRQPLANLTQLLWHVEDRPNQTHTIARQCATHGWEAL